MRGIGRLGLCRFGLFDRRLRLVLALVENPKKRQILQVGPGIRLAHHRIRRIGASVLVASVHKRTLDPGQLEKLRLDGG